MSMRREVLKYHTEKEVMQHYHVPGRTARRYLMQGYAIVREYPNAMPNKVDCLAIAKRSAKYVLGRQGDVDLLHEGEQSCLIQLWKQAEAIDNAASPEAMAHAACRNVCLTVLKAHRASLCIPLDVWLSDYETDSLYDLDMQSEAYDAVDSM